MKTCALLLPLLALAAPVAAQHTELIGLAGAGLLRFAGKSAIGTASVSYANDGSQEDGYVFGPYGSRFGLGFAVGSRPARRREARPVKLAVVGVRIVPSDPV